MKLDDFDLLNEAEDVVKIKGIFRNLTNDEEKLYRTIKDKGVLFKTELSEFEQWISSIMVSKGLITRKKCIKKDDEHYGDIYFVTKGRIGKFKRPEYMSEVAPPSKESESWIKKNKKRFKEKYGKDYGKYLYGKSWNMFNGKK